MFCYIDQPRTRSFSNGLIKTKSGFIVRLVETVIGKWTLTVAVISVDLFLAFLDLTYHFEGTGTDVFWSFLSFPSADKNTGIVLVPCHAWKCVPAAIYSGVDISEVPGCHLLWQMSSHWESQKLLQGLVSHELTAYLSSVFNLFLTQWIMSYHQKDVNQITLNHTTI